MLVILAAMKKPNIQTTKREPSTNERKAVSSNEDDINAIVVIAECYIILAFTSFKERV